MARATRIALDMALVSLETVRPLVSKLWSSGKSYILSTRAKSLVCNPVVEKTETALDNMTCSLMKSMTALRDKQLPKEQKYLECELKKVKERISKTKL